MRNENWGIIENATKRLASSVQKWILLFIKKNRKDQSNDIQKEPSGTRFQGSYNSFLNTTKKKITL
jgi:hypothetical protein